MLVWFREEKAQTQGLAALTFTHKSGSFCEHFRFRQRSSVFSDDMEVVMMVSDADQWAHQHFGSLDLGDPRRSKGLLHSQARWRRLPINPCRCNISAGRS
jgi:hypothetical protein